VSCVLRMAHVIDSLHGSILDCLREANSPLEQREVVPQGIPMSGAAKPFIISTLPCCFEGAEGDARRA